MGPERKKGVSMGGGWGVMGTEKEEARGKEE